MKQLKPFSSLHLVCCALFLIVGGTISCTKGLDQPQSIPSKSDFNEVDIISVEDAITTLNNFLSHNNLTRSEAGEERSITSVETHYSATLKTRAGESIPDAYLVNFDKDAGYAVLGANSSIDPIVAVIEQGNTDWETLLPSITVSLSDDLDIKYEEGPVREYLGPGIAPDNLVSLCVRGALYGNDEEEIKTKAGSTTNILLNTLDFGQNATYCHNGSHHFVTNGCASTALSIIVAYNKYPKLLVDDEWLDLDKCNYCDGNAYKYQFPTGEEIFVKISDYFTNPDAIPSSLTELQKRALLTKIDPQVTTHGSFIVSDAEVPYYRTRYKVTSANFYSLNNIIKGWDATGTMPSAATAGLKNLGYTGVQSQSYRFITDKQTSAILYMLSLGKPVLMCGWTLSELSDSHYWVVDGINITDDQTLFHCNWGWNGTGNGWFARHCLRSDSPVPLTKSSDPETNNGWNHLIVYQYSMETTLPQKKFTIFKLKHRATY
jgi:hypothetical protein